MKNGKNIQEPYEENELLLASIPSILIAVDKNDLIFRWNRSAEITFGLCSVEMMGNTFSDFSFKLGSEKIIEGVNNCRSENRLIFLYDIQYKRLDNIDGFLNVAINPLYTKDSEKTGFLFLANDITSHKLPETRSVRSQKLESINLLAARLAHEINTPIQYVSDNSYFLQQTFDDINNLLNKYVRLFEAVTQHSDTKSCSHEIENFNNKIDTAYLLNEIPKSINENIEGLQIISNIVKNIQEFSETGEEGMIKDGVME